MKKSFLLSDNKLVLSSENDCTVMIFENPDDEEKKKLTEKFKIDEHTLQSSLDPDELSRLEFESDHIALIAKKPKRYSSDDNFLFKVTSYGLFLFADKLIIVTDEPLSFIDDKKFMKVGSLRELTIKILFQSVFHFNEHLKSISLISSDLENKLRESMENKYLLYMFSLSKSLVYYLNAISSNSILLQKLTINETKMQLTEDEKEILEDLRIENSQCYRLAEIYSNILSGMMDARASIVSNNLNSLMKTLNIITIGIMVPTFVVSAFSMNVKIPLEERPEAFWIIMGFAIISVLGFLAFWRLKKW